MPPSLAQWSPQRLPRAPAACARKRRFEEDERQSIPNVLQGEVARLDPKFLVNLDPSHCSNNGTVHLICKLGEQQRAGPARATGPLGTARSPTDRCAHATTPGPLSP